MTINGGTRQFIQNKCDETQLVDGITSVTHSRLVVAEYNA